MRTRPRVPLLLAALLAAAAPARAQQSVAPEPVLRDVVLAQYARIDASVLRVRTDAEIPMTMTDHATGDTTVVPQSISVEGTGVVVGKAQVNGRTEYLVLTNHHVADVSNYVIAENGYLRENKHNTRADPQGPEASFLERTAPDGTPLPDIPLVEVARNVRGDMALLRTVGADAELPVFDGPIGYASGEDLSGREVITSGFPAEGAKVTELGKVVDGERMHRLGQPHVDFTVDVEVEHGQSGSPVFLVEPADGGMGIRFRLVGLIHAREDGVGFVVPTTLWGETLKAAEEN